MALRLNDYVLYGTLNNSSNYSTHGYIALRGDTEDEPFILTLSLTGDCDKDLRGKQVRFRPEKDEPNGPAFRLDEHNGFQDRQIGPTGTVTAESWVRTFDCSVDEFIRRSKLGEPPPTAWKRRLYIEWFGQNGRVVVELGGVIVEECIRLPRKGDENDDGDWAPLPSLAIPPELDPAPQPAGPEFTVISIDKDTAQIEHWVPPARTDAEQDDSPPFSMDTSIEDYDEDSELREMELIDYCMEQSEERPLMELMSDVDRLPAPDELDDNEIEAHLKALLGQMAMLCVALDVCEHYTPRECYRLLRERVLAESSTYEELIGTGWVTHIMTSEFCNACDEKYEREFEEEERKKKQENQN